MRRVPAGEFAMKGMQVLAILTGVLLAAQIGGEAIAEPSLALQPSAGATRDSDSQLPPEFTALELAAAADRATGGGNRASGDSCRRLLGLVTGEGVASRGARENPRSINDVRATNGDD